jgi:uncharacterized membrane protein
VSGDRYKQKHLPPSPSAPLERPEPGDVAQIQAVHYSGPLPHPSLLAKYNELIPNGAERIMAMAERQSAHRESLEKRVVNGNVANQTRGSYFAFILALVSILCGVFLIHEGKSGEGLAAIITSVGGLVSVFFYSKREQRKERVEKAAALQSRRSQ